MLRSLLLSFFLAGLSGGVLAGDGHPYVVDGDTLIAGGQRLRLINIDAPETYKPRCPAEKAAGDRATARLRELVALAKSVVIHEAGRRDKYDRPLVWLEVDGYDAGELLMAEGLALPWQPGRAAWEARRRHWCGD